jgi:hypothetical protein
MKGPGQRVCDLRRLVDQKSSRKPHLRGCPRRLNGSCTVNVNRELAVIKGEPTHYLLALSGIVSIVIGLADHSF